MLNQESTLSAAEDKQKQEAAEMIEQSLPRFYPKVEIAQETLGSYTGAYLSGTESRFDISQQDGALSAKTAGGGSYTLDADSQTDFSNELAKLQFQVTDWAVSGRNWGQFRGTGARGIAV